MGSFEINSAELGTIISQYQRIGRDLSNYSGRIRRATQRLNSQKGFGIETVRNNLTHLSSNSNAHSRDAYIFGGFLKDLETESTNAENQVSKGMYDATPTKMSLTQLVAGALAILVGFVFSKPLVAPIAAWLAAIINNKGGKAPDSGNAPTPSQPPKPVFPTDNKPNAGDSSTGGSSTGSSGTTGGSVVGGAAVGGAVAGGATGVEKEPAPAKPETPQVPAEDTNTENIKVGTQIDRSGPAYGNENRGQCTWFAKGRVNEITGKKPEMDRQYSQHPQGWLNGNAYHTDTANGGCITNGRSVDIRNNEIPQRGALMSWRNPSPWGHVAVVEKVIPLGNGEYEILYSEANVDGKNWDNVNNCSIENPATDGKVKSVTLNTLKNSGTFIDFTELL